MRYLFALVCFLVVLPTHCFALNANGLICALLRSDRELESYLIDQGCRLTVRNPGNRQVSCALEDGSNTNVSVDSGSGNLPDIILMLRKDRDDFSFSGNPDCTPKNGRLNFIDDYMVAATKEYASSPFLRVIRAPIEIDDELNTTKKGQDIWIAVAGNFTEKYTTRFLLQMFSEGSPSQPKWMTLDRFARMSRYEEYSRRDSVQIFGQTFATATESQMRNSFASRGWMEILNECWYFAGTEVGCVRDYAEYIFSNNELGLSKITANYFLNQTEGVDYLFKDQTSYLAFVKVLDERYGVSSRSTEGACIVRNWEVGETYITGSFCDQKPEKWRIAFMNFEVYDRTLVFRFLNEKLRTPRRNQTMTPNTNSREIPADMY
jgi:hypothetical protein